jgi:hypothetical protein
MKVGRPSRRHFSSCAVLTGLSWLVSLTHRFRPMFLREAVREPFSRFVELRCRPWLLKRGISMSAHQIFTRLSADRTMGQLSGKLNALANSGMFDIGPLQR